MLIRVHTDGASVDFSVEDGVDPYVEAEDIIQTGVWVTPTKLYPPSRIVYIEVVE